MRLSGLLRILDLNSFVAFDFETTGLDPDRDRIIEFAAVRFRDGEVEDSLSTLVNPQRPIPSTITAITGIDDNMVSGAPAEKDVLGKMTRFLGEDPLVAHNIGFDLGFLKKLMHRHRPHDPPKQYPAYDTLFLAQSFLFFLNSHNLRSVGSYFGYDEGHGHRALEDAVQAGHIFLRLVEEASSYPLSVIQKILTVLKPFPVSTKELFLNLANHLVKENLTETGLVESKIDKNLSSNVFDYRGSSEEFPPSSDHLFGENGLFVQNAKSGGEGAGLFEVRSHQIRYSSFIDKVFSERAIGITEAGTGLGKSLAYLYPALEQAKKRDDSTIISCYTKHLQDQLFLQEIPKLAAALDIPFTATLLKGRRNYLCETRLERLLENPEGMLSPSEAQSLVPVIVWLTWTKSGDFDECPGFLHRKSRRVKELIHSEPGFCTRQLCAGHDGCFLGPIREASRGAHLVVVNHSLLLAEMSNPGILPPVTRVIVDEAHNLVRSAYDQFQVTIDHRGIRNLLSSADRTSSRSRRLRNRMEVTGRSHPQVVGQFDRVQEATENVLNASRQFFQKLAGNHAENYAANAWFEQRKRYRSFEDEFQSVGPDLRDLAEAIQSGLREVSSLEAKLNGLPEKSADEETAATVERLTESFSEIKSRIDAVAIQHQEQWVYWETGRFENGELTLSLNGVPVDVGKDLVEILFRPLDSVVVTSATLRGGDGFEYVASRLGIDAVGDKRILEDSFDSPFRFEEQCRYFQWAGDTSPDSSKFPGLISDLIEHVHSKWGRRTMVLFTSWKTLEQSFRELVARGVAHNINPLVQSPVSSRTSLLTALKNSRKGILMGTRSFWEGVDLPNDLLEILIVTKLPFDVPNDPVVEAYGEKLLEMGRNPFLEYSVPEARMRFRQGFGRLIRTTRDEGIFISMDNRVVKKRYGHYFQKAIPVSMIPFHDPSELS
ncbi:MAG: helicase C-terminal domain-containing protein [Candidatus Neomarinimicrobiota bacterium]